MKFITSTFARLVAGDEDVALIPLAAELIAMFSGVSTGTKLELRGLPTFSRSCHPEPMRGI